MNYLVLAYQLVLPHGLIRINVKTLHIANNYNYATFPFTYLIFLKYSKINTAIF